MRKILLAVAAFFLLTAQTPLPPYAYAPTIGTSAIQVLGVNTARKRLIFINPNASNIVAVCPQVSRGTGTTITCTINGPGSITIAASGSFQIDAGAPGSQGLLMSGGWNAVANGGGSSLTILEFE